MRGTVYFLLWCLLTPGLLSGLEDQPASGYAAWSEIRILLAEGRFEAELSSPEGFWLRAEEGPVVQADTVLLQKDGLILDGSRFYPLNQAAALVPRNGVFCWDGREYRGTILISSGKEGLRLVNKVEVEDYLRGVVPRELLSQQKEAVKAQAVVARTYALSLVKPDAPYDLVSGTRHQVYTGVEHEHAWSDQAIRETEGQVLVYQDRLAREVVYHSTCGGSTAASQEAFSSPVPYLESTLCGTSEGSPFCADSKMSRWSGVRSFEELEQDLTAVSGNRCAPVVAVRIVERTPSGRVARLEFTTAQGVIEIEGERARRVLKFRSREGRERFLPSTLFDLDSSPQGVKFVGRGWGHGVGMCQWGAIGMARADWDYRRILEHYYRNTEVWHRTRLSSGTANKEGSEPVHDKNDGRRNLR